MTAPSRFSPRKVPQADPSPLLVDFFSRVCHENPGRPATRNQSPGDTSIHQYITYSKLMYRYIQPVTKRVQLYIRYSSFSAENLMYRR